MQRMHCTSYRLGLLLVSSLSVALGGCVSSSDQTNENGQVAQAVRLVIEAQQAAWNRGDIEGFMDGYERAETTTFVSGDELTRGWQTVLDRYRKRYTSHEQMGTLTFSDLEIQPLASLYAVADGRWRLTRAADAPHGRFTLLFRKTDNGWRIVHDTTTSAPE
jgi:ketosteroid isomerase-like protein